MITQGHLQGHWRRDWIKAPGLQDHTTRVHWLQAGALFADIRVPGTRPDLSGFACLADLPDDLIAPLLTSEGFAGTIHVAENRCTWLREINWQGVPERDDIGLMSFDGDALIEDGILAEYRELWQPMQTPPLRGHRVSCDGLSGVLIENDDVFLIGLGPAPTDGDLRTQFASTYALGIWDGARGIATLSTNPFCEGQQVLERDAGFTWHAPAFDGPTVTRRLVPTQDKKES